MKKTARESVFASTELSPSGGHTLPYMIGTIRQHLNRIRYHSASQERTMWHRIADGALFITFFLGFAAALAGDYLLHRDMLIATHNGQLHRDRNGHVVARRLDPGASPSWLNVTPIGRFEMHLTDRVVGWPLAAWRRERPSVFDVRFYGTTREETGTADELRAVIVRDEVVDALEREARAVRAQIGGDGEAAPHWPWLRWLINAGIWWVALYMLFLLAMLPVRFFWRVRQWAAAERAELLRRKGLCEGCGYDLRGLEFHARCPECGKLIA